MGILAVDRLIGNPSVVNFAAGQPVQQQLQDSYAMEHLAMRLTGQLVLDSYSTPPAKLAESIENLIQSLGLSATGSGPGATTDQLTNTDFAFHYFKTRMMEGTPPTRIDVGTANGTYLFETNAKHYFVDPRSNASRLSTLFTALLSSLTATYQFRDATAVVTGGVAGTATLSNVQLIVQSREYLGLTPPSPSPYVKLSQRIFNVIQSQNGLDCNRVPTGNVLRRQYFKGLLGANSYSDPSDTVFGATGKPEGPHITLSINNATTKLDQVYQAIRVDNKLLFGVETIPAGYAIYEPARNRKLGSSIPMAGVANADNYIDVNYTGGSVNTIQITDEEIVKLSAAQFNQQR
jgi:hypothetical protein